MFEKLNEERKDIRVLLVSLDMDLDPNPEKVRSFVTRKKLKSTMEKHGFQSIRTEWWHYSYAQGSYPLDDWQWMCNK